MKLYFGVTTFKWYLPRKSYIMESPHLSGYFPCNSGHLQNNITYIVKERFEIIFWGYHFHGDISPINLIFPTLVPEVYFYYFHCEGERKNKPLVESSN